VKSDNDILWLSIPPMIIEYNGNETRSRLLPLSWILFDYNIIRYENCISSIIDWKSISSLLQPLERNLEMFFGWISIRNSHCGLLLNNGQTGERSRNNSNCIPFWKQHPDLQDSPKT